MKNLITISNNGKELTETNYWELEHSQKGKFYVSINAGCIRLLCPPSQKIMISEMKTGKIIIISKGFWTEQNRDGVEIMFEDNSESPFALHLSVEQFDFVPKDGKRWRFAIYTKDEGKIFDKKCKVRTVKTIPYMKEWRE